MSKWGESRIDFDGAGCFEYQDHRDGKQVRLRKLPEAGRRHCRRWMYGRYETNEDGCQVIVIYK